MDENLVGYLLKTLEPDAQHEVEGYLRTHPEERNRVERLRRSLAPLAADPDEDPPSGLWIRTLARIAEHQCRKLPAAPEPTPAQVVAPSRRSRRPDVLVAAGILLCLLLLLPPLVARVWHEYQVYACKNNLRLFHQALIQYSETHDGALPMVEAQGARGVAGAFIPMLNDAGALSPNVTVTCTSRPARPPARVTVDHLEYLWDRYPEQFRDVTHNLAGCYAYTLGYFEDSKLIGLHIGLGDQVPVLADCPPVSGELMVLNGNSPNHGGKGQNVLFLGGQVEFQTNRAASLGDDDIYLNQRHRLAAGLSPSDSVLGPSWASPCPPDE
jgi:hypothetical protein